MEWSTLFSPAISIFACLHQWGRTANTNGFEKRWRDSPEHNAVMCFPSTAIWSCGCCDSSLPNIRAACALDPRVVARRSGAARTRGTICFVAPAIQLDACGCPCARMRVTMPRYATGGRITTHRRVTLNLPLGRLLTSVMKRTTRAAGRSEALLQISGPRP